MYTLLSLSLMIIKLNFNRSEAKVLSWESFHVTSFLYFTAKVYKSRSTSYHRNHLYSYAYQTYFCEADYLVHNYNLYE